jgi:flagellar protein FlaG
MLINAIQPLQASSVQIVANTDSDAQESSNSNNSSNSSKNSASTIQSKATGTVVKQDNNSTSDDELQKSIEKMFKALGGDSTSLKYEVYKATNTIMVKVIDNDTQKVIREIPSEKVLDMIASFSKSVGISVDKKA